MPGILLRLLIILIVLYSNIDRLVYEISGLGGDSSSSTTQGLGDSSSSTTSGLDDSSSSTTSGLGGSSTPVSPEGAGNCASDTYSRIINKMSFDQDDDWMANKLGLYSISPLESMSYRLSKAFIDRNIYDPSIVEMGGACYVDGITVVGGKSKYSVSMIREASQWLCYLQQCYGAYGIGALASGVNAWGNNIAFQKCGANYNIFVWENGQCAGNCDNLDGPGCGLPLYFSF